MSSNEQLIKGAKELMVQEFSDQVDSVEQKFNRISRRELKKEVLKIEKDTFRTKEKLSFLYMSLAALIYKNRFKREIILKGVGLDAEGNLVFPSDDNVSSNV